MNFFDSFFKKDNDLNMKFSLEISPQTDLSTVPPVSDIYITMLPGGDYKETAQQAIELVKKGFNPVPHFPARSMRDEKELKDYVSRSVLGPISNENFIFRSLSFLKKLSKKFNN